MPLGIIAVVRFFMWFFSCDLFAWCAALLVMLFCISVILELVGGFDR